MNVTILTDDYKVFYINVSPDMDLGELKRICSINTSTPVGEIFLTLNGLSLGNDNTKLKDYNIVNGSVLNLDKSQSAAIQKMDFSHIRVPKQKTRNVQQAQQPPQNIRNDCNELTDSLLERIRLNDVQDNLLTAMDQYPESFGSVCLLYIHCKVNDHEVKALVDSGAQVTIMSQVYAERCGLMRLVDTRYSGMAVGVGSQKIIGRVHLAQLQIGNIFLPCSFNVLENFNENVLIGVDMLKRHQCMIDFMNDELFIGTSKSRTKFLPEGDVPKNARLNQDEPKENGLLKNPSDDSTKTTEETKVVRQPPTSTITPPAPVQTSSIQISESSIQLITDNGFSREQAITELKKSKGDVDEALAALFTRVYQF